MNTGLLISSHVSDSVELLCERLNRLPETRVSVAAPGSPFDREPPDLIHWFDPKDLTNEDLLRASGLGAATMVDVPDLDELLTSRDSGRFHDRVKLLALIDVFLCADEAIRKGLHDFGIPAYRLFVDSGIRSFPADSGGDSLQLRIDTLLRAGGSAMAMSRIPKWRQDRENSLLRVADLRSKRLQWESKPSHIEFSTNNLCNLQCITCRPHGPPPVLKMNSEEATRICDQTLPGALVLSPFGRSEPLLSDLDLLCDQAKKHEVKLNVITNGMLLTPANYERIRPVLGRLQVSLDSHEPGVYHRIRRKSSFDRVVRNVRRIAPLVERDGVELLTSMVVMTINYPSLPEYMRFVHGLGVKSVLLQRLNVANDLLRELDIFLQGQEKNAKRLVEEAAEEARRLRMNLYAEVGSPGNYCYSEKLLHSEMYVSVQREVQERFPDFCYMLATYLAIAPEGRVYPCCVDTEDLVLGNMKEQSFEEVWNGEHYQRLREEWYTGNLRSACAGCPFMS